MHLNDAVCNLNVLKIKLSVLIQTFQFHGGRKISIISKYCLPM